MIANDVCQDFEEGFSLTLLGKQEVASHIFTIIRMASSEFLLDVSDRLGIAQLLSRPIGIHPPQNKATLRSSEPAPQDVVEGVQILSPFRSRYQNLANVVVKRLKIIKFVAIYFIDAFHRRSLSSRVFQA